MGQLFQHFYNAAQLPLTDVKPGDIGIFGDEPLSKAHGSLDATIALEVTTARAENQLLLQAGFVEPDDFAAVVRPAHVVVSVLTPSVFKLQGHPGVRGEKLFSVCRNVAHRANLRLTAG